MTVNFELSPEESENLIFEFGMLHLPLRRFLSAKIIAVSFAVVCLAINYPFAGATFQLGDLNLKWLAVVFSAAITAGVGGAIGYVFGVLCKKSLDERVKQSIRKHADRFPRSCSITWDDEKIILKTISGEREWPWETIDQILAGKLALYFLHRGELLFLLTRKNINLEDLPAKARSHLSS